MRHAKHTSKTPFSMVFLLAIGAILFTFNTTTLTFADPATPNTTGTTLKVTDQKTEFFGTGHPGLTIHGTSTQFKNDQPDQIQKTNGNLTGKITVDMTTFDTGMGLRDKHTKSKIFEVEKFPTASMQFTNLPITDKTFKGTLSFHGVTKEITGTQEITASSYKIDFSVNVTDYNITPPTFAGMSVDSLVKIEVTGHLQ